MNVIVQLAFEFAYYNSAIKRFNYQTMRTPPRTFYSCTLFKEINSGKFFHFLEDGQHDILYWP